MSRRKILLFALGILVLVSALGIRTQLGASTKAAVADAARPGLVLESAAALAFGPNNVLFIGDTRAAAVYAVDLGDEGRNDSSEPMRVEHLDRKIAGILGVAPSDVVVNDLAVHPGSRNIYLAVSRGRGNGALPVLLRVTKQGSIDVVALHDRPFSSVSLRNAHPPEAKDRWGQELRRMTITDLAWADGELLVAGLSSTEFASTLRRAAYPFRNEHAVNTLEIFHTSHDKYETQSPVTAFLPLTLKGKPSLLAAYGCAPIASFTLADLRTRQHLRGTTLAELGGGNRPLDMIAFEKEGKRRVLIANSSRTLMSMSAEDIENAPPITKAVTAAYVSAGVPYLSIAEVGVTQIDNLDEKFVVAVQRNIDDGSLVLRTISKAWL